MQNELSIESARKYFADAIAAAFDYVPKSAEITIRNDPKLGDAAAIHCQWPLVEKGPYSGNYSREIVVQINSRAMNRFRLADARIRGDMLNRFSSIFGKRLDEGGYNEQDPSFSPFLIHINEHSLD